MTKSSRPLQFPQLRIVKRRRMDGTVMVEGGVRSAMQSLFDSKGIEGLGLTPPGASFGSVIEMVETGAGIRQADAQVINKQVTNPAPDGSTPTADQVLATSYKKDSKCVIRMEKRNGDDDNDKVFFEHFSLQSVSEPQEEKYQVHEVFEGEKIYFFGSRPRFWTYNGIVLNAADAVGFADETDEVLGVTTKKSQSFADDLIRKYREYYRGTRAVENDVRILVTYEDIWVDGLMINMSPSRNTQFPNAVNMTFTLFVIDAGFFGDTKDTETLDDLVNELSRQTRAIDEEVDGIMKHATPQVENLEAANSDATAGNDAAAADLQKAAQEEAAAQGLLREKIDELDKSEEELQAARESFGALGDSPSPSQISTAGKRVDAAEEKVRKVSAELQELYGTLDVISEDLTIVKERRDAAVLLKEHTSSSVEKHATQFGGQSGLEAAVARKKSELQAEGGIIVSSRELEQLELSGFSVVVEIIAEYPDGKDSNRSIKFETFTMRVKK